MGSSLRPDETRTPVVARARRARLLSMLLREQRPADRPRRAAAINELVGLEIEHVRRRAARRLRAPLGLRDDVEIVVSLALVRLASALMNTHATREASLIALVNSCVDLAAADFLRERIRRRRREQITDPDLMPEPEVHEVSACRHAQAAADALAGLTTREQQIVSERALLGLTPSEVATRHRMTVGAVYVAHSRALAKLRSQAETNDREP